MTPAWLQSVIEAFPFLAQGNEELTREFIQHAQHQSVPAGQLMCLQGQPCQGLGLILDGRLRVYKTGEQGREITLYRVSEGDTCILSVACILSQLPFPAFTLAESPIEVVMVPADTIRDWIGRHPVWREHVFAQLTRRLVDVMSVLEDVTFTRLDARLATYLLAASDSFDGSVATTHQSIADDLGTSREVISRLLKDFERKGLVSLARGTVQLADNLRLRDLASGRM